ncbi:MAG TPA: glycosyltransferase, partial [Dissulfurispiraceae bacterium]|nr:glycosyltransferase [Dissulfurispiraceae bacterium]
MDEAFTALGHTVLYDIWDAREIAAFGPCAVLFECKLILKEPFRFMRLARSLHKAGIPTATWSLDIPNIGARPWKIPLLIKSGLLDVFASHSMQGLPEISRARSKIIYLPNAAWTSRYNLAGRSLEDLRAPDNSPIDVSFVGNLDSRKYPEHKHRTEFLKALAERLEKLGLTYHFEGAALVAQEQIRLIQASKINVTFGCGADRPGNKSWGMPERCYGIPACGGFLLADERMHARDDFVLDEEIVLFSNLDDCVEKVRYFRDAHRERRKIAENAYAKV